MVRSVYSCRRIAHRTPNVCLHPVDARPPARRDPRSCCRGRRWRGWSRPGRSGASPAGCSGGRRARRCRRASRIWATSWGWTPSTSKLRTPPRRSGGRPVLDDAGDLGQQRRGRTRSAPARGRRSPPADRRSGSRSAAPRPMHSAIAGVPASNFHGSSFQVVRSSVDRADHLAAGQERIHRLQQLGRAPTARRSPGRTSCGPRSRRSRSPAPGTSTGRWGAAWAPSTTMTAPSSCAQRGQRRDVVERAQRVGRLGDRQQLDVLELVRAARATPGRARRRRSAAGSAASRRSAAPGTATAPGSSGAPSRWSTIASPAPMNLRP